MREHPYYKNILVSEDGHVYSNNSGRFLKSRVCENGYSYVSVYLGNGKSKSCRVHRLVAETYIPNPENFKEIDHIDCDKTNNSVCNLEWVDSKENKRRAIENGLYDNIFGGNHYNNKHDENTIIEICKKLESGATNSEIVSEFGISKDVVAHIKCGNIWRHISSQYDIQKTNKPRKTLDEVHEVCKMIVSGLNDKEISDILDIKPTEISRIRRKKTHKKISDGYWVQRLSNEELV
jgi:DNA-binding CsgD family transcriptional regulator